MAKGNGIIVTAGPRGRFLEGIVSGTPKPGTIMEIVSLDDNGEYTFQVYTPGSDGLRPIGPLCVLLLDELQGRLATTAYSTGDHCFCYVPLPGDELNVLLKDIAGSGDDHAFGELLIPESGSGKLIATTGTPEIEPFAVVTAVVDPLADTLAHVICTGY